MQSRTVKFPDGRIVTFREKELTETVWEQPCFSIAGARGSGKTSTARALITAHHFELPRRLIFTPKPHDFAGFAQIVVRSAKALDAYLRDVEPHWPFSVIYKPEDMSRSHALAYMCRQAMYLKNCVVIADELHDAAHRQNIKRDTKICVKEGRDPNVGFVGISQGIKDIDMDIRKELESYAQYHMLQVSVRDRRELDALRDGLGDIVSKLHRLFGVRIRHDSLELERFRVDPRGGAALLSLDGAQLPW